MAHPTQTNWNLQSQPNNINLVQCIYEEPVTLLKNRIGSVYSVYKKSNIVGINKLQRDDLVVVADETNNGQCSTAKKLRDIIARKDQEINHLKEDRILPLVSKCVHFYGNKIIIPDLKRRFIQYPDIQRFRGWSDCIAYAYRNDGSGEWLQEHIYQVLEQRTDINRILWDALASICQERNRVIHGSITRDNIRELEASVSYWRKRQMPYTSDNKEAVRRLAAVLKALPNNLFDIPVEQELADHLI